MCAHSVLDGVLVGHTSWSVVNYEMVLRVDRIGCACYGRSAHSIGQRTFMVESIAVMPVVTSVLYLLEDLAPYPRTVGRT